MAGALSILASLLGETVLSLAFANFGVCGGPFLGMITCAFIDHRMIQNERSVIIGTIIALIICAIGGYGSVFGLKENWVDSFLVFNEG